MSNMKSKKEITAAQWLEIGLGIGFILGALCVLFAKS